MADVQISVQVTGLEQAQAALSKIGTGFAGLGDTVGAVGGRLTSWADSLGAIGAKASLIGIPFALAGKSLLTSAADFEASMNKLQVVAGGTADQMKAVSDKAKEIGGATTFSAGQALEAFASLAKNGVSLDDALSGAIDAAVNLAAATGTNLGSAADVAAKAMAQFQRQAGDLPAMMDQMFNATQQSTFELGDMANALAQGGGAAATAGISFRDTVTALSTMSYNFAGGADAGTSFKTMLIALAAPTKKQAEAAEELGISVRDAHGNFLPLRDIIGQLQTAFSGLGTAQKEEMAATMVGQDAFRALLALADQGVEKFDANAAAIDKTGTSLDAAAIQMKGLWGALDQLGGAVELVGIALTESGFVQYLSDLILKVSDGIEWFSKLPAPVLNSLAAFTALMAVFGPLVLAIGAIIGVAGGVVTALGFLLSPIALVVAAVVGLTATAFAFRDDITRVFGDVLSAVTTWASSFVSTISDAGGQAVAAITTGMASLAQGVATAFGTSLDAVVRWADAMRTIVVTGIQNMAAAGVAAVKEMIAQIVGYFTALPTKIGSVFTAIKDAILKPFQVAKDVLVDHSIVPDMVDSVIGEFGRMLSGIDASTGKVPDLVITPWQQASEEIARTTGQIASAIADTDWGLDRKMAAFDALGNTVAAAGSKGAEAMRELHAAASDAASADAGAQLAKIMGQIGVSTHDLADQVDQLAPVYRKFGADGAKASEQILRAQQDLAAEIANQELDAIFHDTTLSLDEQGRAVDELVRKYTQGGPQQAKALVEVQKASAALTNELYHQNNVLAGVQDGIADSVRAWGGWGEATRRIVGSFTAAAEDSLTEFFMTGQFDLKKFAASMKQTFASEASKFVVQFAMKGIAAILEWGAAMLFGSGQATVGLATTTVAAISLSTVLWWLVAIALVITALFLLFKKAGLELGDTLDWLGGIVMYLWEALKALWGLVQMLLLPVFGALLLVFNAIAAVMEKLVGWIKTIGSELGKGDLKDLLKIFGGGFGGIFKGIGDFFGGLFEVGGKVPGSGPVPIVAHGGEYVMTEAVSSKYGSMLEQMNAGGDPFTVISPAGGMDMRPAQTATGVMAAASGMAGSRQEVNVQIGVAVSSGLTMGQFARSFGDQVEAERMRRFGN